MSKKGGLTSSIDPVYFALITGASGGIGYELSFIMAEAGHNLVLVARSEDKLSDITLDLKEKFGIKVYHFAADLSIEEERLALIDFLRGRGIEISILVNNAGFGDSGFFAEADWQKNEKMIQLNITALTHLTREFLPEMIASGHGRILNVASLAGFLPGPLMSVYYASKSFVVSFSNALHSELKRTGVTVTTLSPGPVSTNFFIEAGAPDAMINKILGPASANSVASFAYNKMMKGKRKAIHGFKNKIMIFGLRFMPTAVTNTILKRLHR